MAYCCGGGLPLLAGGGLAGGVPFAPLAPLSAGGGVAAPLSPDGLDMDPELSDGAAGAAGALLCEEAGGAAEGSVLAD